MLIYGFRTSVFGNRFLKMICANCSNQEHTLAFYQRYAHAFWIPLFPISTKKAHIECHHCKMASSEKDLLPAEQNLIKTERKSVSTPIWMFSLSLVLIAFVAFGLIRGKTAKPAKTTVAQPVRY